MIIVGMSAFYHESSCCLLKDGQLIAAAEEERFSRIKHDARLPVNAFRFCLEKAGCDITDIDCLAWYEIPEKKLARQLWGGITPSARSHLSWLDATRVKRALREKLGYEGPIEYVSHHQSHAAAAWYFSGFDQAAILTIDGVGEWATTTYGTGHAERLEVLEEVDFPHSLGLLYATITSYLGFRVNDGEYKVMGLAPYGKPRFLDKMYELIRSLPGGSIELDMTFFDFLHGDRMYSPRLCKLFGAPPRKPDAELTTFHMDVARSLQLVFEEVLLEKVTYLAGKTQMTNLCMAGGAALNCVANGRILREGPFDRLFVFPAAGDSGAGLGAAALAFARLTGKKPETGPLTHACYGPSWSTDEVKRLLSACDLPFRTFAGKEDAFLDEVASCLEQKLVVGWFQGSMELGPRALGARSILANPLDPDIRDRLNGMVKKRESFRPFAPSVLAEHAADHFDLPHESPFMLQTCQVRSPLKLPGITHVDGSARPQTVSAETAPRYAGLLERFFCKTGCPMLVNTSFNVAGEPIVCSPVDALFCFANAGLDVLAIEDIIIYRQDLPALWQKLLPQWERYERSRFSQKKAPLEDDLYTFV